MLLSENTLSVLKNFSTINPSLFFREGNVLRTMNQGKTILAEATIEEQIPTNFGIHDLSQLLSILSLHKSSPELTIQGSNAIIQGGRSKIVYRCCAEETIKGLPTKSVSLPSNDITFSLIEDDFNWIMKSSAVLKSPNIAVVGERNKIFINTFDAANDAESSDMFEVSSYTGEPFYFVFKVENWKMIPATYQVTISSQGIASFESQTRKITYWIALESKKK